MKITVATVFEETILFLMSNIELQKLAQSPIAVHAFEMCHEVFHFNKFGLEYFFFLDNC